MILDSHCHLFTNDASLGFVSGSDFNEFIREMDETGVDQFILFTLGGLFRDFQASNDEIAAITKQYPERVIPFGTVNPFYGEEALKEIERCVNVLKFKGFKLHPWMMGFPINSEQMDPIMQRISDYNLAVVVHSGTPPWSAPLQIAQLAGRFPKVRFVLAHMGITDLWREALDAAKRYDNIFLETAGTPTLAIKLALKEFGPERVIFGSDSPYGGNGGCAFQLNKLKFLNLNREAEEMVFGGNLKRILNMR